jgi:hypothetical protein
MAELRVEGGDLVLHLTGMEKAESVHGDLRAPLSAVRGVEILDDAHGAADFGIKVGTRIHGVIEVGAIHGKSKQIFAAVHHDTPRGVRVVLAGSAYGEWIVGCADPGTVVAALGLPKATT